MENSKKPLNYIQAELVKEKREKIGRLIQAVQLSQNEYALVQDAIAEALEVPEKERPDWQLDNSGKFLEKRLEPKDKTEDKTKDEVKETIPQGEKKRDEKLAPKP